MAQTTTTTKVWYKSKILLLAAALLIVGGTDLAFGWLTGAITPEQLAAVQSGYPQLYEGLKKSVEGGNYFGIITTIAGFLTAIWRAWFTSGSPLKL